MSIPQLETDRIEAVRQALLEDIRDGDITAMLIPEDSQSSAKVITREDCVIAGVEWVNETFRQLGPWCINHLACH